MFITFEGTDGCGKTTQIKFFCDFLKTKGISFIQTREPGGTPVAEKIRNILLDKKNVELGLIPELLLLLAARKQHLETVIEPALKLGQWVICDRFSDATIAYQCFGSGLSLEFAEDLMKISGCSIKPDKTFFIDIDVKKGLARAGAEKDRFEERGVSFLQKVRDGYKFLASREPKRIKVIDGSKSIEEVTQEIQKEIS